MTTTTGRKRGRPSTYSESIARALCDRIADGESLRAVCEDPAMPDRHTVRDWRDTRPDFDAQYARAREQRADDIFDGLDAIESAVLAGELDPNAARVVADIRRWRLARMSKRYSDRQEIEITGNDNKKTYAILEASPEIWSKDAAEKQERE